MPAKKVVLNWTSLQKRSKKSLKCTSVKFHETATRCTWYVELEKCGNETAARLCLAPSDEMNMFVVIKFVLHLKKRRRVLADVSASSVFSRSKLMSESRLIPLHYCNIDVDVKICVEFGVPIYTPFEPAKVNWNQHEKVSSTLASASSGAKLLAKDKQDFRFLTFLQSGNYCDVTISVGTREINCHKSVLSWRSSYFDAMFKSDLIESRENRIEITDFDYETIKAMIDFLYTFECPELTIVFGMDLLKAADKYLVLDLRDICAEFLMSEINVANAADILLHADVHSVEKVKKRAMEYILGNPEDFKDKDQFQPLMSRPELLRDLFLASRDFESSSTRRSPVIVWYKDNLGLEEEEEWEEEWDEEEEGEVEA